jgi:hypothetical protein
MLHVSNITLPTGVEISEIILEQDQAIVSISEIKEIIEEEILEDEGEGEGEEGEGEEGDGDSSADSSADSDSSSQENVTDEDKSE